MTTNILNHRWIEMKDQVTTEPQEIMAGGTVSSSKIPPFELIPMAALESLARIFEEGVEKKPKGKAWNGTSPQYKVAAVDRGFVINRLAHVIHHAYKAIEEVAQGKEPTGENHAGAIMFGGSLLACHLKETAGAPGFVDVVPEPAKHNPLKYDGLRVKGMAHTNE